MAKLFLLNSNKIRCKRDPFCKRPGDYYWQLWKVSGTSVVTIFIWQIVPVGKVLWHQNCILIVLSYVLHDTLKHHSCFVEFYPLLQQAAKENIGHLCGSDSGGRTNLFILHDHTALILAFFICCTQCPAQPGNTGAGFEIVWQSL